MTKRITYIKIALLLMATVATTSYGGSPDERYRMYYLDQKDDSPKVPNWRLFDSWRRVYLNDGELMVEMYRPRPKSSDPEFRADMQCYVFFSIQKTKDGMLIQLHPMEMWREMFTEKSRQLEGFYLTVDYSTKQPSLKFTKEPEKASYWEIRDPEKRGPLVNKNESGKPVYLMLEDKLIPFKHTVGSGTPWYSKKIGLSDEPATFCITKEDLNDGGL